jgi:hypothetical protein
LMPMEVNGPCSMNEPDWSNYPWIPNIENESLAIKLLP